MRTATRVVIHLSVLLIAALVLTGCGAGAPKKAVEEKKVTGTPSSYTPSDALELLKGISAPGADWTDGTRDLGDFAADAGGTAAAPGVWKREYETFPGPVYFRTWDLEVTAGQEKARCAEAAEWIQAVGKALPGEIVVNEIEQNKPTVERNVEACMDVISSANDFKGDEVAESAGMWPEVLEKGYVTFPYFMVYAKDGKVALSASVTSGPRI